MSGKIVYVTPVQVAAARLRLELDAKAGRAPSLGMQRIASAVLPSDGPGDPPRGGQRGTPRPDRRPPSGGGLGGRRLDADQKPAFQLVGQGQPVMFEAAQIRQLSRPQITNPAASMLTEILGPEQLQQVAQDQPVMFEAAQIRQLTKRELPGRMGGEDS